MLPDIEFWRNLVARMGEVRRNHEDRMLQGKCGDYADYKYEAGYLRALDDVEILAEELDKAMNAPRRIQA